MTLNPSESKRLEEAVAKDYRVKVSIGNDISHHHKDIRGKIGSRSLFHRCCGERMFRARAIITLSAEGAEPFRDISRWKEGTEIPGITVHVCRICNRVKSNYPAN